MKRIQAAYLRPPVTPQQGEAYLAEMPALEVRTSRYPKQALLAQHYQELLQSHCVPDCLRLFKEISCKPARGLRCFPRSGRPASRWYRGGPPHPLSAFRPRRRA